jgi:hypothetical protein
LIDDLAGGKLSLLFVLDVDGPNALCSWWVLLLSTPQRMNGGN